MTPEPSRPVAPAPVGPTVWEAVLGRYCFLDYVLPGGKETARAKFEVSPKNWAWTRHELTPDETDEISRNLSPQVGRLEWMLISSTTSKHESAVDTMVRCLGTGRARLLEPCVNTLAVAFPYPPASAPDPATAVVTVAAPWLGIRFGLAARLYPLFVAWLRAALAEGGVDGVKFWFRWHRWVAVRKVEADKPHDADWTVDLILDPDGDRVADTRFGFGQTTWSTLAEFADDPYAWLRHRRTVREVQSLAGL